MWPIAVALSELERSERRLGYLLLLPAVLLLATIVVYPVFDLVRTSFYQLNLTTGLLHPRFTGLANYARAFADHQLLESALATILLTVISVPSALVTGLALALLADQVKGARWFVRLALLMPWMLPLVFVGLVFHWFFDYRLGIVNDILVRMGLSALQWLSSPALAFIGISLAIIWKTSAFVAMILLAGLQSIPKYLYEAAEIDGAGTLTKFRYITLPMLRPSILVALIFRTITSIQTFDIPYAMTNGGPGNSTETLAMFVRKTSIDFLDFGYGSALATLMFIGSMLATSVYLKHVQRDAPEG
ncbi:MAG: sugar ABC transporter permease [Hyphomicrobiales bacterium]|nr:sugar ABC transporter permease [Hyphomicrobiales bacterium]MDE2113374.1 sugar ABC transporter permease [Hyphomicrobiales bacterium]